MENAEVQCGMNPTTSPTRKSNPPRRCESCGVEFSVPFPSNPKRFCTNACALRYRRGSRHHRWSTDRVKPCAYCAQNFNCVGWKRGSKFCSQTCRALYFKEHPGPRAVPIGTVRQDPDGYRFLKVAERKWRPEHILIVEAAIGRKLSSKEIVHHRNGNPSDNRIENLQVMTRQEHMRIHHEAERIGLRVQAGELAVMEVSLLEAKEVTEN